MATPGSRPMDSAALTSGSSLILAEETILVIVFDEICWFIASFWPCACAVTSTSSPVRACAESLKSCTQRAVPHNGHIDGGIDIADVRCADRAPACRNIAYDKSPLEIGRSPQGGILDDHVASGKGVASLRVKDPPFDAAEPLGIRPPCEKISVMRTTSASSPRSRVRLLDMISSSGTRLKKHSKRDKIICSFVHPRSTRIIPVYRADQSPLLPPRALPGRIRDLHPAYLHPLIEHHPDKARARREMI